MRYGLLAGPSIDLALVEASATPAALGVELSGPIRAEGRLHGPLSDLVLRLAVATAAGDLAVDARADLTGPETTWAASISSPHLRPGALVSAAPAGLTGSLSIHALGQGDPLTTGFALGQARLIDLLLDGAEVGDVGVAAAIRAGDLDLEALAVGSDGAEVSLLARGALPPGAASAALEVRDLDLAAWGERLSVTALRGRVDTARVGLTAALTPWGVANVVVDVDLSGRSVGLASPLGPEVTASIDAHGRVQWTGSGAPTGRVRLDVTAGAVGGATVRSAHVDLHVTRPRGTDDARVRATMSAVGAAMPGGQRVAEASLGLDVRGPATPPDWRRARPTGSLTLSARGLASPEASLAGLDARLDAAPEGGDVRLRGPITLRGLAWPGLGAVDSAVARLDARVDPLGPDVTGEAALAVAGLHAGSFELHTAALSVSRDASGTSRVSFGAERGSLRYEAALRLEGLTARSGRLTTTLEALRVTDGATGLAAAPGALLELATGGDLRVTGLALSGTGDLGDASLDVAGSFSAATRSLDGRVALKGVDLERWLRFGARLSGLALPTDLRGVVDGSVRVAGTGSNPELDATLRLRDGQVGTLHNANATVDATLAKGRASLRATAGWAPSGRLSLQVEAPATLRLEADGARLSLPSDGVLQVRADSAELDLATFGAEVQGKPLKGSLTAALKVDGTVLCPVAVLGARVKALTLGGLDSVDVDGALVLQPEATRLNLQVARAGTIPIRVEADLPLNLASLARLTTAEAVSRLEATPFSVSLGLKEVRLGTIPFLAARFPELDETTVAGEARVGGTLAAPTASGALAFRALPLGDVVADLDLSLATDGPRLKLGARVSEDDRTLASLDLAVPDLVGLLTKPDARAILTTDGLRLDLDVPGLPAQRLAEIAPGPGAWLTDLLGVGEVAASASVIAGKKGPTIVARALARANGPRVPGAPEPFARELLFDATLLPGDARVTLGFAQRKTGNALTVEVRSPLDLLALVEGSGPPLDQIPLKATARTAGFDLRGLSSFLPQVFGASSGALEVDLGVDGTLARPLVRGHLELRFDELTVAAAGLYEQGVVARIDVSPEVVRLLPLELRSKNGAFELALTVALPSFEPAEIALNGALKLDHFRLLGRDDARATMTGSVTVGGTLSAPVVAGDLTFDEARFRPDISGRTLQPVGLPDDVVFVTEDGLEEARAEAGARLRSLAAALVLDVAVHLPPSQVRIVNKMVDVLPTGDLRLRTKGGPLSIEGRVGVVEGTVEFYGKRFTLSDDSLVVFPGGATIDPRLDITALYDISQVDLEPLGLSTDADSHIRLAVTGTAGHPSLELSSDPAMDQTSIISTMLVGSPVGAGQTRAQEAGVERQTMNLFVGLATGQLARLLTGDLPIDVFRVEAGEQGLATARITVGKRLTRDLTVFYEADLGAEQDENENEVRVQYRLTRRLQFETHFGDAGRGGLDLLLRWRF
jgi:translocation and assembly module TamB